MLTSLEVGSKVVFLDWTTIVGQSEILKETDQYWILSNNRRVKKNLNYYLDGSKKIQVQPWTSDLETQHQAQTAKAKSDASFSTQKYALAKYCQYVLSNGCARLSQPEVENLLANFQKVLGDCSTRR